MLYRLLSFPSVLETRHYVIYVTRHICSLLPIRLCVIFRFFELIGSFFHFKLAKVCQNPLTYFLPIFRIIGSKKLSPPLRRLVTWWCYVILCLISQNLKPFE